jgi:uncharacterized caspase-like protein
MRSLLQASLAFVIAMVCWTGAASAQKRVALVIGNAAYAHTAILANPKNDAGDVAATLASFGFEIVEGYDLDKTAFERTVRNFATALQGAEVAVFFYAGHALQVQGQNYLVPIDAELTGAAALDFEMVRLDLIQRTMETQVRTNILFLDACRDNPLAKNLARSMGTRSASIGRGLASVEAGVGTLISFSTQPGNVALDGGGRNSPFAGALVRNLRASGHDDLSTLLISVRNDVMKATSNKQVPWEHSSLTGRFFFNPAASASATGAQASPAPAATPRDEAADAWAAAKESTSPAVLQAFIKRFDSTFYAELARERLQALQGRQAAATPTPAPAAPSAAQARGNAPSSSDPWTLAGNKSLDLLGGRVLFSMIGTPHRGRRDRVGIRVNGAETSLTMGEFVHLSRAGETCGIFLREINLKTREADFQVLCGREFGNPPKERAPLAISLPAKPPKAEVLSLDQGTSRQFEAGNASVLITFTRAPYRGRRDLVGVSVHGAEQALAIGQRVDVQAGDQTCGFVLREIHAGYKTAEFQWQC